MTRKRLDQDLARSSLDEDQRRRIAETLGPTPRNALSALVEYGLNDHDIARYHELPMDIVAGLREMWGIPSNS